MENMDCTDDIASKRFIIDLRNNCACSKMYDFYQAEKLCDLVLISEQDKTRIPTHRVVLSARSEYFETMFTTSMKEKDMKEVPLGGVSGTILKNLVEYCYTGQFHIDAAASHENVIESLEAATMFRLDNLAAKCADYLKNHVNLDSCLITWTTANLFDLRDLASNAIDYISSDFLAIVETDAFGQLKEDTLYKLLNDNEMVANSEDVFKSIFKWIEFDAENRRQTFEKLTSTVQMSQISYSFLVEHVRVFLENAGLSDAFHKVCKIKVKSKPIAYNESPRKYDKKCLYSISTNINEDVITIQKYNQSSSAWEIAHTFYSNLNEFDVVCHNNELFFIGGGVNRVATNKVRCLRLNESNAVPEGIQPMKYERYFTASAKLFGFVYVTGGFVKEYGDATANVERLNLKTMEWTEVTAMQQKRGEHAAAVLSGKLFVTGGWEGSCVGNKVEYYDPQLSRWTPVSSMNKPRGCHRCVVVNNIIYAVGGFNRVDKYLSSIERYDEVIDKWTLINMDQVIPRENFGAVVSNNSIFIVGGQSESGHVDDFEMVNIETNEHLVLPLLPLLGYPMHLVQGS